MLLHLPIAILATLSPVAVSDTVPRFDIVRECRFEGGSTTEIDRCSDDENIALRQLERAWTQFGDVDKRGCMATATTGGVASYVELLTCLEMAGHIKNGDGNPRGPQTTEAMRLRAPGVTVGVGHDPITPGQKLGRSSR
jgi:hypothetical protein